MSPPRSDGRCSGCGLDHRAHDADGTCLTTDLSAVVSTLAKAYADAVNYDGWMTPEQHRNCVAQATVVLGDVKHCNFGNVTGSAFHYLQQEAAGALRQPATSLVTEIGS